MNINELPTELLSRVLNYLHPADWIHYGNVCKNWAKIFDGFWAKVHQVEYESAGYFRITYDLHHRYRLSCSDGPWNDDSCLLTVILKHCGENLEKLILHIPREPYLNDDALLEIPVHCPRLKALSINGHISTVADCISLICHDLPDLEELFIWDDSFPENQRPADLTAGDLVRDILSTCRGLRRVDINFMFTPPPSLESCRYLANLPNIERIGWLILSPLDPEYLELFLQSIVGCRATLRDLLICCKLKAPIDGDRCARYLRELSENGRMEKLNLGFQLHEPLEDDGSGVVYYEPFESAPWTLDVVSALSSFDHLRALTLAYFELSDDRVLNALKNVCKNLDDIYFEDNYGVSGKLAWILRSDLQNAKCIKISQATLTHSDLVELILHCPKLETLSISNIRACSFKKLVLNTHSALHHCSVNNSNGNRTVNLKLDTACGYIHDEAAELKKIALCGMRLLPPGHSNVFIDQACTKLDD